MGSVIDFGAKGHAPSRGFEDKVIQKEFVFKDNAFFAFLR